MSYRRRRLMLLAQPVTYDTTNWIVHEGDFVTHQGSPVTYDIPNWVVHDGSFITHQGSPVTYGE